MSTIKFVNGERIGYDAVVGALNRQVGCEIKWEEVAELGTGGIDEIALTKGHKNDVAVITTRQKNGQVGILAVLEDRMSHKSFAAKIFTTM